jgi:hypothetical protein
MLCMTAAAAHAHAVDRESMPPARESLATRSWRTVCGTM